MAHRSFAGLKDAGFSTQQAEAILDTVEDRDRNLVTKADLDTALQALELRLTLRMGTLMAAAITVILAGVAALTRL